MNCLDRGNNKGILDGAVRWLPFLLEPATFLLQWMNGHILKCCWSIKMSIGMISHYFSNLCDIFEDSTHHTFASHRPPPPPARSALPCSGFSICSPTVYRCSSSRIWGLSAWTRLVRINFRRRGSRGLPIKSIRDLFMNLWIHSNYCLMSDFPVQ